MNKTLPFTPQESTLAVRQGVQLTLTPEQAHRVDSIKEAVAVALHLPMERLKEVRILKRSIDARSRFPKVLLQIQAFVDQAAPTALYPLPHYQQVAEAPHRVVVVGSGPAGLFAALTLIEQGIKPIVLERGKEVGSRKRDIALLNRNEAIDANSNYCFGEGGAGTFSDGKLYTRSKKRGDVQRVFEIFHHHGADESILYEAHPHIGSDKLPTVIKQMRETIRKYGGEVRFNTRVEDLIIEDNTIKGCITQMGETLLGDAVILAIGHSAHDTYKLLHQKGVTIEPKGFAMGVRVEHPQKLIDTIQYKCQERGPYLPAASYSLVTQVNGRGVYSFCMCPGGHIVPAGSCEKEGVVNGMSASQRNSPYANSGIVVEIRSEDIPIEFQQYGPLAGLYFQQHVELLSWQQSGGGIATAPAQRLTDFVNGRKSTSLPQCSYLPGIHSSPLHSWLPPLIARRLQEGFRHFEQKMRGFLTPEAVVVGVESRSSSPVRIPRDRERYEHIFIKGLYPCGEGAGYAGGITSSAMDGINAALQIARRVTDKHNQQQNESLTNSNKSDASHLTPR